MALFGGSSSRTQTTNQIDNRTANEGSLLVGDGSTYNVTDQGAVKEATRLAGKQIDASAQFNTAVLGLAKDAQARVSGATDSALAAVLSAKTDPAGTQNTIKIAAIAATVIAVAAFAFKRS